MANEKPRYEVNETVLITKTNEKAVVREIIIDKEHNFYGVRLAVFKPHGFDEVTVKLNEIEKVKRPAPKDWFEDEDVVYFSKVRESAKIPTKRDEDGCYDIYCDFSEFLIKIQPHEVVRVPTGIASAFSPKYRFNTKRERGSTGSIGLMVASGQIDSGFRAEWFIALYNPTNKVIIISKGTDKTYEEIVDGQPAIVYPYTKGICQAALEEVPIVKIKEIPYSKLEKIASQRGKGMLGSSNK